MDEEPETTTGLLDRALKISVRRDRIKRPYDLAILEKLTEDLRTRIGAAELEVAELQGAWRREKAAKEPEAMRILAANYLEAGIGTDDSASHIKAEQFRTAAELNYRRQSESSLTLAGAGRSFTHD